jgi:hypothetical protein
MNLVMPFGQINIKLVSATIIIAVIFFSRSDGYPSPAKSAGIVSACVERA